MRNQAALVLIAILVFGAAQSVAQDEKIHGTGHRTIADLEQAENIQLAHLQEAINYRMLDREFWT